MAFIVDAPVALCWLLPDQQTQGSEALLERAEYEGLVVPELFHLEVANKLGLRRRAGKMSVDAIRHAENAILSLSLKTEHVGYESPMALLQIMQRWGPTSYDSVYLDLALRLGLPLATFDAEPAGAARGAGVELA